MSFSLLSRLWKAGRKESTPYVVKAGPDPVLSPEKASPKVNPFRYQFRRGTKSTPGAFGKPKGGRMERKLLRLRKLGLA